MMEANNTDRGSTKGTIRGIEKVKNFKIIIKSKSLPANSDINNQTVWSMNMKKRITNTVANVVRNVFNKYLSRIFT
jgi:hypothetical protein